ncbi:hypothetical protein NUW54_g7605 [Trametes sanguinea]|uniref:Uncharacterized protein n=1 Tax=Trametes sanguinea TaxID=158606 RepID=A0ACC1PLD1_9APHY|nr:hypothetical protein NUW54_g7605 [Trametes sanguinea]
MQGGSSASGSSGEMTRSDVLEDMRVNVRPEGSETVLWYKASAAVDSPIAGQRDLDSALDDPPPEARLVHSRPLTILPTRGGALLRLPDEPPAITVFPRLGNTPLPAHQRLGGDAHQREQGPAFAVRVCEHFNFNKDCATQFGIFQLGSVVTQVIANADVGGLDGQSICSHFLSGLCPAPFTTPLNLTNWFAKPKPNPLPALKKPSGKRMKVLHLSDMHLDPRYANGAEANCTSGLCCRENNFNTQSPNETVFPAPRFGAYLCDSPLSLIVSALQSIPVLAGTERTGFDFTLYTGDLVSHDSENQLSRDYVSYTETLMYDLLKRMLGKGPVYAALGNHDTYNQAQDAPHALNGQLAQQFSWNYDHVAKLWQQEGWLPESAVNLARSHYAAYMVRRQDGLRVITLNTDMWYTANYFNYINMTNPDLSGMLRFLTDELQAAEDAGDAVWILGHVLTGWDGTNPLQNPTNLFYQIVDRFSPHVIKAVFFGHTHEDQVMIYYANNATNISAQTAGAVGWIAPSITPLTNLNSGFRVYEVDSATFEILDAHTWKSDVNSFPQLDGQNTVGPTYEYEYSTRDAYGGSIAGWPQRPLERYMVAFGHRGCVLLGPMPVQLKPHLLTCIPLVPRVFSNGERSLLGRDIHRIPSQDLLHAQRERLDRKAELHTWVWLCSVESQYLKLQYRSISKRFPKSAILTAAIPLCCTVVDV